MFQQHRQLGEGEDKGQRHKHPELCPEPRFKAKLRAHHLVNASEHEEKDAPIARQFQPAFFVHSIKSGLQQDLQQGLAAPIADQQCDPEHDVDRGGFDLDEFGVLQPNGHRAKANDQRGREHQHWRDFAELPARKHQRNDGCDHKGDCALDHGCDLSQRARFVW